MTNRKWTLHRDPANPTGGRFTLAEKPASLPPDAVISLTLGIGLSVLGSLFNSFLSLPMRRSLAKNPNLLYAEMVGELKSGTGLTMTVWSGQARHMAKFRDSGAHKFAMKFFSWIFFSGKAQAYFLTFPASGRIPTADEAMAIAQAHGRHFDGGKLVQKATRFDWGEAS